MNSLALIAAIFLLAGFVKGVIGMGLPTVAVGVLGLLMSPSQAAAVLILPSLVTNIWQAVAGGHFKDVARRLWPMLVAVCIGTYAAALVVPNASGGPYVQSLGFDRDRLVQALGISFTVSTIALAAALSHTGEMTTSVAVPSIAALVAAFAGMVVGQKVRGLASPKTFRLCFFIGLLALGAHLALHGLL